MRPLPLITRRSKLDRVMGSCGSPLIQYSESFSNPYGLLAACGKFKLEDAKALVHKIKAGDVERLIGLISSSKAKAEQQLGRSLEIVLCYEVGYDGFWLARLLITRGIRTVVFDPASFLLPRRGRRAKTDRLDADTVEGRPTLNFVCVREASTFVCKRRFAIRDHLLDLLGDEIVVPQHAPRYRAVGMAPKDGRHRSLMCRDAPAGPCRCACRSAKCRAAPAAP